MEISAKEYVVIDKALEKKAQEYARNLRGGRIDYHYFYSFEDHTCAYKEPPKFFRTLKKDEVSLLRHFLPFSCDYEKRAIMASKEETICLAVIIEEEGNDRYYLTTHRIGRCPWKVPGLRRHHDKG